MLHILWILLKFILVLLGILLGLVLLTVLLVLFCPVRYRADMNKESNSIRKISAKIRISWLFGAISFRLQYSDEKAISDFRLFGISIMKLLQKFRFRKKSEKESATASTSAAPSDNTSFSGNAEHRDFSLPDADTSDTFEDIFSSDLSEDEKDLEFVKRKFSTFFYKLGNFCRLLRDLLSTIWQKLNRIPSSIENFTLTIEDICAKINAYRKFLDHPRTKAALSLVKEKIFKLLKHVFPTKAQGKITFGSTDPSLTGTVLAVLGMTMPLHKNCITVMPLFKDQNILLGNIQLKGRIYGIVFLKTAIELYFNKNIKYIIRRWKHKED